MNSPKGLLAEVLLEYVLIETLGNKIMSFLNQVKHYSKTLSFNYSFSHPILKNSPLTNFLFFPLFPLELWIIWYHRAPLWFLPLPNWHEYFHRQDLRLIRIPQARAQDFRILFEASYDRTNLQYVRRREDRSKWTSQAKCHQEKFLRTEYETQ